MGRRKRSDTNRTLNFSKGDKDQANKRVKIGLTGKWTPGKENQPPCQNLTDSNSNSNGRQVFVSPTKLIAKMPMRSRFRLARDSQVLSDNHSDPDIGHSFHEFQVFDQGNYLFVMQRNC